MTLLGAYESSLPGFKMLVLISVIGIVITAAFLLYAMQRVFLGKLNPKYAGYSDMTAREVFCQAPFLFLCVVLGVFPMLLMDWMRASIDQWVATMGG
jgi:NADH-quinone oxidoreductase subunit M